MNLQNKTLLITGIDEFIGLRAAELAVAQGMKVKGIQSSPVKDQTFQKLGVEIFNTALIYKLLLSENHPYWIRFHTYK